MSMLSMQINRLRSCADLYDGTTKPEMAKDLQRPGLAQELRDAADTILELRDDLQRANAENARLRQEIEVVGTVAYVHGVKQLQAENAKLQVSNEVITEDHAALCEQNANLRELVRNLLRVVPRDVSGVVIGVHGEHPTYYSFDDAMSELGIEVDG